MKYTIWDALALVAFYAAIGFCVRILIPGADWVLYLGIPFVVFGLIFIAWCLKNIAVHGDLWP